MRALNYILKPYETEKIAAVLHTAMEALDIEAEKYYVIDQKGGSIRVPLSSVKYFASDRRTVHAVTTDEEYTFYEKLGNLESQLPDTFVRIHNRYLVHMKYIEAVRQNTAVVGGTVGSLLVLLLLLFLFRKGEWYMKVTTAFIVYPAMMALAFLFQDIGQQIWENVFHKPMSDEVQTALFVFTRFLKEPAWYLIYRCVKVWMPRAVRMLTRRMWSVLAVISLSSFTGILITIYQCSAEESYLAWPSCIAVLVTSTGCCYLCTCMAKIVRSDMERETMQYQKSYYQEIENSQQTVRSVWAMVEKYGGVMDVRYTEEEFSVTVCLMQNCFCK